MERMKISLVFVGLLFGIFLVSAMNGGLYYKVELYYTENFSNNVDCNEKFSVCPISGNSNKEIVHKKGEVSVNNVDVVFMQGEVVNYYIESGENILNFKLNDFSGMVLKNGEFAVPNLDYYDSFNESSGELDKGFIEEVDDVTFQIYVPYYENAKDIVIYDSEMKELIRKDVSEFSKGVVLNKEDKIGKLDGDGVEDGVGYDKESVDGKLDFKKKTDSRIYFALIGILVFLVIVLIYFLTEKEKQKKK